MNELELNNVTQVSIANPYSQKTTTISVNSLSLARIEIDRILEEIQRTPELWNVLKTIDWSSSNSLLDSVKNIETNQKNRKLIYVLNRILSDIPERHQRLRNSLENNILIRSLELDKLLEVLYVLKEKKVKLLNQTNGFYEEFMTEPDNSLYSCMEIPNLLNKFKNGNPITDYTEQRLLLEAIGYALKSMGEGNYSQFKEIVNTIQQNLLTEEEKKLIKNYRFKDSNGCIINVPEKIKNFRLNYLLNFDGYTTLRKECYSTTSNKGPALSKILDKIIKATEDKSKTPKSLEPLEIQLTDAEWACLLAEKEKIKSVQQKREQYVRENLHEESFRSKIESYNNEIKTLENKIQNQTLTKEEEKFKAYRNKYNSENDESQILKFNKENKIVDSGCNVYVYDFFENKSLTDQTKKEILALMRDYEKHLQEQKNQTIAQQPTLPTTPQAPSNTSNNSTPKKSIVISDLPLTKEEELLNQYRAKYKEYENQICALNNSTLQIVNKGKGYIPIYNFFENQPLTDKEKREILELMTAYEKYLQEQTLPPQQPTSLATETQTLPSTYQKKVPTTTQTNYTIS